jgi:hypothetical protein
LINTFENYAVNIYKGIFATIPLGGKIVQQKNAGNLESANIPPDYLFKYDNRSRFFKNCFEEADSTH